jgi:hypothetical protein
VAKSRACEIAIDESTGELFVANYSTKDQTVVRYFAAVPEDQRPEHLDSAIKLGVVALRTMGTAKEVDLVERCFDSMLRDFSDKIEDALGDEGRVNKVLDEYFGDRGEVTQRINDVFGDDGQFARHLKDHFGPDGKIVKELLDPSVPGTPLAKIKDEFERQFVELRKDLAIAKKEEEMTVSTTLKGGRFEDEFEYMISEITRRYSDSLERKTEDYGAVKGSKKGDFVICLSENPDLKITFETKDKETISLPTAMADMKEAIENREAAYGVLVARDISSLPKSVGWFNEYNGNTLIMALGEGNDSDLEKELLWVGYKWARMRVLASGLKKAKGFDMKVVMDKVKEAESTLKKFSQIRTQCTNAKSAIEEIRNGIDTAHESLTGILDEIEDEIIGSSSK